MSRRAVTLVEVLLALALTAVAFLAVLGLFLGGISLAGRSQEVLTATAVAREQLEHIRSAQARPAGDYDGRAATPLVTGTFPPAPYPQVDGRYQVRVRVAAATPELSSVQVDVYYGNTGHVELETLLPR